MTPDLSVIVPLYNEEESIGPLYRAIVGALDPLGLAYEILFVDDGSRDATFRKAKRLAEDDRRLRVVKFRKNYGQTPAMVAGIEHARGRVLVTMDGDLQNDPADIAAMLARLDTGADIVCGWRRDRKDSWLTRRLPSALANRLISWATGVRLNDYGCSLKVFRAEIVKPLRLRGEMHRFLPALASELGVVIVEMPVNHRPRTQGTSKYGLGRIVRVMLDLLTVKFILSYSTRPLQIFGLVGGVMSLVGAVLLGYLGILRLLHIQEIMPRLPLTLFGILLLFTGVQLVTLGLLAELQARTYHEATGRPVYVIREVLESSGE